MSVMCHVRPSLMLMHHSSVSQADNDSQSLALRWNTQTERLCSPLQSTSLSASYFTTHNI